MKISLFLSGFITVLVAYFTDISKINQLKNKAEEAFLAQKYSLAYNLFDSLTSNYNLKDEELFLNKANALYLSENYKQAKKYYRKLTESKSDKTRSAAWNQLGLIFYSTENEKEAFKSFKNSIIENPSNNIAVYNYEVLKKVSKENQQIFIKNKKTIPSSIDEPNGTAKQKQTVRSEDGEEADLPGGEKKQDKEGQLQGDGVKSNGQTGSKRNLLQSSEDLSEEIAKKKNEGGSLFKDEIISERLLNNGISPERARQILNAMKNEEIRYLQQLKHKQKSKQKNIPEY